MKAVSLLAGVLCLGCGSVRAVADGGDLAAISAAAAKFYMTIESGTPGQPDYRFIHADRAGHVHVFKDEKGRLQQDWEATTLGSRATALFVTDLYGDGKRKMVVSTVGGRVLIYDLDKTFPLVLVPYNSLMHFRDQNTQIAVLERLRKWTAQGGLLVLDLPNAGDVFATQETGSVMYERTFLEPQTGHMVMQQSVSYLDRVQQLLNVTWIYDEITGDGLVKRTIAPNILYYYFYSELKLLLERTGFEVEAVCGDADDGPFEDGCERMIVFAKPL